MHFINLLLFIQKKQYTHKERGSISRDKSTKKEEYGFPHPLKFPKLYAFGDIFFLLLELKVGL